MTEKPLRVWIVEVGEPLAIDPGTPKRMRASLLSEQCAMRGHEVTWFTSAFNHYRKQMRPTGDFVVNGDGWAYTIVVLPALGYRRHISIARFRDHRRTAAALKSQAPNRERPDIICAGLPTLDLADVCGELAAHFQVPLVVDVQDLWPDVLRNALPRRARFLGHLLGPLERQADRACAAATAIVGTSPPYVEWGLSRAGRVGGPWDRAFSLTSDPLTMDESDVAASAQFWRQRGIDTATPVFAFVGSFSRHFRFEPLVSVIREWNTRRPDVRFVLCGEGPDRQQIVHEVGALPNCVLPGWVNAREGSWLLHNAIAGLAPYVTATVFEQNYTNKVLEYLSMGLPIISSLQTGLQGALLREEGCGLTYDDTDSRSLSEALHMLLTDEDLRDRTALAARRVFSERFSTEQVYGAYATYLEELAATADSAHAA